MPYEVKSYALLVGINEYPAPVPHLNCCIDDVARMRSLLDVVLPGMACIKQLIGEEATRDNVIAGFKSHLRKAKEGEVAFFYFAGHGSRQLSAREFTTSGLSSEGLDETLVCFDSRVDGGLDLADKELAVLIQEVSRNGARVVCMLDSCHSGGGTRKPNNDLVLIPRFCSDLSMPRPLETYLDGHYMNREFLFVPESAQVVFSACQGMQMAYEVNGIGLFTFALVSTWRKLGADPSIHDLFSATSRMLSVALASYGKDQVPQLTIYGDVDPRASIFAGVKETFHLYNDVVRIGNSWWLSKGTLDGKRKGDLIVAKKRPDGESQLGKISKVGLSMSKVVWKSRVTGKVFSSVATMRSNSSVKLSLNGGKQFFNSFYRLLGQNLEMGVKLVPREEAEFCISEKIGGILFENQFLKDHPRSFFLSVEDDLLSIESLISKIIRWKNGLLAENKQLTCEDYGFSFADPVDRREFSDRNLIYKLKGDKERLLILGANKGIGPCYMTLIYFQQDLSIIACPPIPVPPGVSDVVLFGQDPSQYIYLNKGEKESHSDLRLIVTRNNPNWFMYGQHGIQVPPETRSHSLELKSPSGNCLSDAWAVKKLSLNLKRV